jgi:hypothetical protein
MKIIKKHVLTLLTLMLLAATGCRQTGNVQELLQDKNNRQKVFTAILDDEKMRNEFMDVMRERNMGAMMGQGGMMHGGGMMADSMGMAGLNRGQMQARMQQMMALCQSDSAACNLMAGMMMRQRELMGNMMQRMQQRGMMDDNCLQQMRRRLKQ